MSNKLIVGITGGIGSGKSIVARIFEIMGAPVYPADFYAKWLMTNEPELKSEICRLFGEDSYLNGELNRKMIAETSFHNPEVLQKLNGLVHPFVQDHFKKWVQERNESVLFKEAALLFETGSYKKLDKTVVVISPEKLRIQRILKRDKERSEHQVKSIIQRQWSDEQKKHLADYIIYNDESSPLLTQTLKIADSLGLNRNR
jgi:dephospho-CoA kinase